MIANDDDNDDNATNCLLNFVLYQDMSALSRMQNFKNIFSMFPKVTTLLAVWRMRGHVGIFQERLDV